MLGAVLLTAVLAQGDGAGAPGALEDPQLAARRPSRLHASVAAVVGVGVVPVRGDVQVAPGVMGDVGFQFNDRMSMSARLTVATIRVMSLLQLAVAVDFFVSERLSLGLGVGTQYLGALTALSPSWLSLSLPLQASWMFSTRAPTQVERKGVFAFVELTPAAVLGAGIPSPTLSLVAGAGWTWR
jgi:hypothetical protein